MSIPKVIHYCWFGKNPIPKHDQYCIESWKKYCPDYEIIEWNENNYDVTKIPYMHEAYQERRWGFVSDYARLDIIHQNGGVYLDTDVELIRNIDDMLNTDGFAGVEKGTNKIALGLGFGAVKGHPLLKELCEIYQTKHFRSIDGKIDLTPIPQIVTDFINLKYPNTLYDRKNEICDNFWVYPSDYFCPQNYENGETEFTKNTYSIHHYHASWKTESEKKEINQYKKIKKLFGKRYGEYIFVILRIWEQDGLLELIKHFYSRIIKKYYDKKN